MTECEVLTVSHVTQGILPSISPKARRYLVFSFRAGEHKTIRLAWYRVMLPPVAALKGQWDVLSQDSKDQAKRPRVLEEREVNMLMKEYV